MQAFKSNHSGNDSKTAWDEIPSQIIEIEVVNTKVM